MKPLYSFAALLLCGMLCLTIACRHEPKLAVEPEITEDRFPPEVGRIIRNNCAVSGCHNAASHKFSGGGLLLDSWEHLFDGGNHGAVVVPYSPENSSLLYFVNSYPDLGPVPQDPGMRMPLNDTPLSRSDYAILRDWILAGAPDKDGNIPFATNRDTRQKIYVAHQGCDYISVIDAEKHVVMRTIPVGRELTIESAHSVQVSPDGYVYVTLWASQYIVRIDSRTDSVKDYINIGSANANMLHIAPDGRDLLFSNWYRNSLTRVNTQDLSITHYAGSRLSSPHGIASNKSFDTFFVTGQFGNTVYRIPATGDHTRISINGRPPTTAAGNPDPHNILMAPDYSRYFLSCEGSNEIRIMDAYTDKLIDSIRVGQKPQEMTISRNPATPYIFVTCLEGSNTSPLYRGSVYIIDYNTHRVVDSIVSRHNMPHGITVDDRQGMLYVFSRNIDPSGPAPHHNSSVCEGRSGYYSVYDIRTRRPLNDRKYELTVDPYSADTRFK